MTAAVITCSNRSAAGERADESGELLASLLAQAGYLVSPWVVVPDEVGAIRAAVRAAIEAGAQVVVTTGGTGLAPTDVTPEAVRPLLEREIPGIAEALRLAPDRFDVQSVLLTPAAVAIISARVGRGRGAAA